MREFFSSLVLFVALAIVFSSLTGCSSSVESGNKPGGETAKNASANSEKKPERGAQLAAAVVESEIKNIDGTTFKVPDKKGKVILLNLWATWCGPCRAEMPSLVRMQDKHRDAGLEIIGLNTDDETLEDINGFVANMKLNYTQAWADTKLQAALVKITEFPGIPQSFLIDRDGKLRGVFKGGGKAEVAKMEELVDIVVAE
ncbi:MAG TPA: TlpA disulfide reductase family protein [Pyrinomonadaceae bacterium]|nr:TlpA disulfide reductase family protein [Pyrinomonadaceae bacterium]